MYFIGCVSCVDLFFVRVFLYFFFFKQKTAYEMRISDWSSDVCSSDLKIVDIFADLRAEFRATLANVRHILSELERAEQLLGDCRSCPRSPTDRKSVV